MKLQIIQIGHPVLNFRSKEIDRIDQTIISLFDNMNETMLLAKGVGLAAPQVAVSKRVMTVLDKKTIRIANPVIIETSGSVTLSEGCLSIPGVNLPITRPKSIQLEFLNDQGNQVTQEFHGMTARIIQHELDHLDGKLIFDYLDSEHKDWILKSLGL